MFKIYPCKFSNNFKRNVEWDTSNVFETEFQVEFQIKLRKILLLSMKKTKKWLVGGGGKRTQHLIFLRTRSKKMKRTLTSKLFPGTHSFIYLSGMTMSNTHWYSLNL